MISKQCSVDYIDLMDSLDDYIRQTEETCKYARKAGASVLADRCKAEIAWAMKMQNCYYEKIMNGDVL